MFEHEYIERTIATYVNVIRTEKVQFGTDESANPHRACRLTEPDYAYFLSISRQHIWFFLNARNAVNTSVCRSKKNQIC